MNRRLLSRARRPLFYVCLDVVVGGVVLAISVGEADLTPGQLSIRILTAVSLANAIVGGPDIMLYWQESGRRIAAEQERDTVAKERDTVAEERDAAEQERDAAVKRADTLEQRLDELSAEVEQLRTGRSARRSRRRRLRNNGR